MANPLSPDAGTATNRGIPMTGDAQQSVSWALPGGGDNIPYGMSVAAVSGELPTPSYDNSFLPSNSATPGHALDGQKSASFTTAGGQPGNGLGVNTIGGGDASNEGFAGWGKGGTA